MVEDLIVEARTALGSGGAAAEVRVDGEAGHLPSAYPVEDVAVACVSVALLAAAALHDQRGHPTPVVRVERAHVADAVRSERYFRRAGRPAGPGFAPLSRFWPTADGWLRTHANYPWHLRALLAALRVSDDPVAVEAATRDQTAETLEERVVAAGGVAGAVRTVEQWRCHPQGRALAAEPLVGHHRLGDAPPRPHTDGDLPARAVRVVDLTRVIAGPVCTRFLGALGAEVLRIDPPAHPDMAPRMTADTLLAKRSASLNLHDQHQRDVLHQLLNTADVLVAGYRPGGLDKFGLGPDDLASRHGGLVVAYLDAWGHHGPWAGRRGFDSVVQAPTGIAAGESGDDQSPGALPCQLLDHGTGYLLAASVLDGLRRQRAEGGTHVRTLSLARTAMWLTSHRSGSPTTAAPRAAGTGSWLVTLEGPDGLVEAVAPPGSLGDTPLRWPGPPARYQQDAPAWTK
jgi:crotonobetainyl-CoA:carnitine CoA-transferase CaiB-like acyl-CoA transferase